MIDLSELPNPAEIMDRIDEFTKTSAKDEMRTHLGASVIGEKCTRKLWLEFRHCGKEQFNPRMLRLFSRGDREEEQFDSLLQGAGFTVYSPTPETVEEFRFSDYQGHFGGTCDGIVVWNQHTAVLEKKTYASQRFKELKRRGVRENDPKYWSQMQTYMGYLELEIALFCAVCKDDDQLYFEWVPFDQVEFDICTEKAHTVITSEVPPPKLSDNPESYACKYCHFNQICHENKEPLKNCRSCRFAQPTANGTWECSRHTFGQLCPDWDSVTGSTGGN